MYVFYSHYQTFNLHIYLLYFYFLQNGLNALHLACKEGRTDVVKELLSNGASVYMITRKGNSALHIASLAGHLEIVKLLVDHGADINAQSQVRSSVK